jgi:aristolochene synthase
MMFTMDIRLSPEELSSMQPLEENCAKQISVVNDIYSWEKELLASQSGHKEGSALCSAVKVLSDETYLGIPATKRVLWSTVREWELTHEELAAKIRRAPEGCSSTVQAYMKGLEYQMSGNELWSRLLVGDPMGEVLEFYFPRGSPHG